MTGTVNLDGLDALHTDRGGWCSHDGQGWPCTTSALVAEVRRLREDADEAASVRDMLASLLTSTANALKGEPEQLWMHDWSDLPQVARQHAAGLRTLSDTVALLTRERGELLAAIARVRALCAGADDSEYTTVFAAAVLAALDVRLLRGESS